jgi:ATP-GRASP peptide maturase of grasp-with-spasm system
MGLNCFQASGVADNMGKVLVQSTSNDGSTDDVLSWLHYLNKDLIIYNFLDSYNIDSLSLSINNKELLSVTINNLTIDNKTSSWYRRGNLESSFGFCKKYELIEKEVHTENFKPIMEFLNSNLSRNQINRFKDNYVGKLDMLYHASLLKIKIPETLITGDSKDLQNFIIKNKKVITKPIKNPVVDTYVQEFELKFISQTKLLTMNDIADDLFHFMPSFFQRYIEKKYEIRTFYIEGLFKSMAIFSQQNEKTKIDFRNYDHIRPNRCVPYQLPKKIEKKLHKFMLKLNLNCGSFDIICTPDNKFVFLEVNPIGQFQWLSYNCNYYVERLISKKIIENAEKK